MVLTSRRSQVAASLALIAMFGGVSLSLGSRVIEPSLPDRISDETFWRIVSEYSEPGGFFRSDNFVSNEITFQWVLPELAKTLKPGGVYLGVGPDQNFTYIVGLKPKVAFIVDIRRQNMLHHLLYKSLIEMSPDRADFLSRLFSRPRPPGLDGSVGPAALFQAYANAAPDSAQFTRNLAAVKDHLVGKRKFGLTSDDLRTIEYVYTAFFAAGPDLTYSFTMPGRGSSMMFYGRRMPTYAELQMESDGDGVQRGYLATEANYRVLRDLERNNLIIPLVGDFAGDKALRSVGRFVRDNGATISAFYTSNVEQYLFQSDDWRRFFSNVATLPVDTSSTFIRAVFNFNTMPSATGTPGPRSRTMLAPIAEQVRAFADGRLLTYWDVIQSSR
ncbi:MAG TPA: hypothetical protein VFZ21_29110 [Gemmatimonadaceae bacterium]|jgi:hypothetical protein|nr:hypothetical protein [Gemmatimonadaceae bacterium]